MGDRAAAHDDLVTRLVSEAKALLEPPESADKHRGSPPRAVPLAGGDIRALYQLLAARALQDHPDDGPLLDALMLRRTTVKIIDVGQSAWSLAYAPDGTRVAVGRQDGTVHFYDAVTGRPGGDPLVGPARGNTGVAFSPDGARQATASFDRTVCIWDPATGAPVGDPLAGHTRPVRSVAFSPDGARLASAGDDATLRLWDAVTGAPVGGPLVGHADRVRGVAFSPDGARLASGSFDGTVRIWDTATGAPVGDPLTGHAAEVNGIAYSPDGLRLASAGGDRTVRVWDTATGAPVGDPAAAHTGADRRWPGRREKAGTDGSAAIRCVAFSPDGTRLVLGSEDGAVWLWDGRS
jgi:WD40 repeat protein